jgi:hypothetical protein
MIGPKNLRVLLQSVQFFELQPKVPNSSVLNSKQPTKWAATRETSAATGTDFKECLKSGQYDFICLSTLLIFGLVGQWIF